MKKIFACLLFGLFLTPLPAVAGTEAECPFPEHGKINTPDASPVDRGNFEIEASYSFSSSQRLWDNSGHSQTRGFTSEQAFGISATFGLYENVDVTVSSAYTWLKDKENDFDEDGLFGPETGHNVGDLDILGRYRFFQDTERNLDIATIGGFTIPAGSNSSQNEIGTSQEYWSFNQTLVASKDWGKWTANADVGYALPFGHKRADARGTINADLALGYQFLPWVQPELELNYSRDFIANTDDADVLAITAGLVMPINDCWRINTGLQQGVWGRNADQSTLLSVAVKASF